MSDPARSSSSSHQQEDESAQPVGTWNLEEETHASALTLTEMGGLDPGGTVIESVVFTYRTLDYHCATLVEWLAKLGENKRLFPCCCSHGVATNDNDILIARSHSKNNQDSIGTTTETINRYKVIFISISEN
jgi:hypothetical protein